MEHATDEVRRLQADDAEWLDEETRRPEDVGVGTVKRVCKTTTKASYPANVIIKGYFYVEEQDVTGDEVEGGPGELVGTGTRFFALNVGSQHPPEGTPIEVYDVPFRSVFRYDG